MSLITLGHQIRATITDAPSATVYPLLKALPSLWLEYGLERDANAIEMVVRRAIVLSQVEEKRAPNASEPPATRAVRHAVEEHIASTYQRSTAGAARDYCERCLANAVAKYHEHYYLVLPKEVRAEHIHTATDEALRQLATYDGTQPLHLWIRHLAHHERSANAPTSPGTSEPKMIERHGIDSFGDWLDLQARQVIERYVVTQMHTNPRSHLATLNLIWTAQHVCLWHHVRAGTPGNPRASLREIWATLLDPVPPELHERIFDHTSDVCERITRGLPSFKGNSALDTWRTTILNNTLATIVKRERRIARHERTLYATSRKDDSTQRDGDYPLPIADPRLSLDARDEILDLQRILAQVVRAFLGGRELERRICELRLSGVPAKEVADLCDVPSARVDRLFSEFKRRVRAEYTLRSDQTGSSPSD